MANIHATDLLLVMAYPMVEFSTFSAAATTLSRYFF